MSPRRIARLESLAGVVCWLVAPVVAYLFLQPYLIGFPLLFAILASAVIAHGATIAVLRFAFSD